MRSISLLFILLLIGCSAGKKTRTLEVSLGSLSATFPTMIYGAKTDGTESFAIKLTTSSTQLELSNGSWKFQSITWGTGNVMEGDPNCSESFMNLSGSDVTVKLPMTKAGCKSNSWMGSTGYFESVGISFDTLDLNFCEPYSGDISAFTNCAAYDSSITGVKVILPEHTNGSPGKGEMGSACYPATGNMINALVKIPFGTASEFPVFSRVKTFHAADPACVGNDCCSGREQAYDFPNGFSNGNPKLNSSAPVAGSNIRLKIEEVPLPYVRLFVSAAPVTAPYQSCTQMMIDTVDAVGNMLSSSQNGALTIDCQGTCQVHLANDCSDTPWVAFPIPLAAGIPMSSQIFIKQTGYTARVRATTDVGPFAPGMLTIATTVSYSSIDGNYLWSAGSTDTDLLKISSLPMDATAVPYDPMTVIIYHTNQGNRGKLRINSVSMTSIPDDTINFDFVTYDSAGAIVASGTNQTIVAGSGAPFLNLELNSPVESGSGIDTDAYFDPGPPAPHLRGQGPAQYAILP